MNPPPSMLVNIISSSVLEDARDSFLILQSLKLFSCLFRFNLHSISCPSPFLPFCSLLTFFFVLISRISRILVDVSYFEGFVLLETFRSTPPLEWISKIVDWVGEEREGFRDSPPFILLVDYLNYLHDSGDLEDVWSWFLVLSGIDSTELLRVIVLIDSF